MRIIFLGTPSFALPTLEMLINNFEVVGVVTQPDKPVGRGDRVTFSPVKQMAIRYNIPVYQFTKIRQEGVEVLKRLNADIMVTCAYGQILSKEILDITPNGVINVHGSMLPSYRGASPIQWAIINGEEQTGITILKTNVGIDDGDIIYQQAVDIEEGEGARSLFERLSQIGAKCCLQVMLQFQDGAVFYRPQDNERATYCKMITKEMAELDFDMDAEKIIGYIRGLDVWPVANFKLNGIYFKVFNADIIPIEMYKSYNLTLEYNKYKNGEVVVSNSKQGLVIKCSNGFIEIIDILPENSRKMAMKSYLNGKNIEVGSVVEQRNN